MTVAEITRIESTNATLMIISDAYCTALKVVHTSINYA